MAKHLRAQSMKMKSHGKFYCLQRSYNRGSENQKLLAQGIVQDFELNTLVLQVEGQNFAYESDHVVCDMDISHHSTMLFLDGIIITSKLT